jgi:hypothetical protein
MTPGGSKSSLHFQAGRWPVGQPHPRNARYYYSSICRTPEIGTHAERHLTHTHFAVVSGSALASKSCKDVENFLSRGGEWLEFVC